MSVSLNSLFYNCEKRESKENSSSLCSLDWVSWEPPPGAALLQIHNLAIDFRDNLDQVTASTTDETVGLESIQQQINCLVGIVPPNQRALDLLAAEQGKTCIVLARKVASVNESGLVRQNKQRLKELHGALWALYSLDLCPMVCKPSSSLVSSLPWHHTSHWSPSPIANK